MLHTLGFREFSAISRQKQEQHDRYATVCWNVVGALTSCWMRKLGSQKLSIMMFLVNRTLYYRKEAQQIWHYQFLDGVVDGDGNSVCDGVGMSKNTFRQHLGELIEQDYVTAWACKDEGSGAENQARLFAINFKKLLAPYQTEGSKMAFINQPKARKAREKSAESDVEGSTENWDTPLPNSGRHNINIKRIGKPILSGRASRSGAVVAGTENVVTHLRVSKGRTRDHDEETPAYHDPEVSAAPREIVSAIQQRTTRVREARVAAAATVQPWMLTKDQLQAMFDKGMKLYFPKLPRVIVTAKEFGFLKKRLKELQPKDFAEFIDWTLLMWTDTVAKHRRAIMRGVTNGDESKYDAKPLPSAPDFATLVYRLPYFLKVHSSALADSAGRVQEDNADKRQIARLQRELENANNTNRIMRERAKAKPREMEEDNPHETAQRRYEAPKSKSEFADMSNEELANFEIPEWVDMGDGGYDLPSRRKRNVR